MVSKNEIAKLCGLDNVKLGAKGQTGELLGPIDLIKKSNKKSLIPKKNAKCTGNNDSLRTNQK